MSLTLALVMCMSLCVPAFAAVVPNMRNQDFDTAPPRGTAAYAYNIHMGRSYGNIDTEQMISRMTVGEIYGYLTDEIGVVFGAGAVGLFAGAGAPLLNSAANMLLSQAAQRAPDSTTVGYIVDKYGYNGQEAPLEHYYKYVVHYYPNAVKSSDGLPSGGTIVTFYELNWFS